MAKITITISDVEKDSVDFKFESDSTIDFLSPESLTNAEYLALMLIKYAKEESIV